MSGARPGSIAAVLLGALISASCSNALVRRAPGPSSSVIVDAELVADIVHAWQRAGVPGYFDIRVRSDLGDVLLAGEVADARAAARAVEIARSVPGVLSVRSQLTVSKRRRS